MDTSAATRARQDLRDVQSTTAKMRAAFAFGGADAILMVWGVIWFLGFLSTEFISRGLLAAGLTISIAVVWLVLVGAGVVFSIVWGVRAGRNLPATGGWQLGMFWFFLYVYIWLAYPILAPVMDFGAVSQAEGARRYAALATLAPMFAYVVMGLWTERYFLWIGLVVTALLFVGLFAVPAYFWVWMAFAGGGALFLPGFLMRRQASQRLLGLRDGEVGHA